MTVPLAARIVYDGVYIEIRHVDGQHAAAARGNEYVFPFPDSPDTARNRGFTSETEAIPPKSGANDIWHLSVR
jgi:hypothetical protein